MRLENYLAVIVLKLGRNKITLDRGTIGCPLLFTIDVTDPNNPQLLGVVKDASGQVAENIMANDITISKTSGLVYAAAGQSVYVIDIKDPKNPVILNIITETPDEPGTSTTTALGNSPALVEKDGWVYLANQQKGMRVLDLDPVEIGIVDTDSEFTDVWLPGRDYYPALGTKAVTVWGIISGEPLDDKWELRGNETVEHFRIGGKLNADGKPENGSPATFKTVSGYREGFATLYIAWDGSSATPWPDKIIIKLQAVKKNATLPLMISVNASEQYSYVFNVRHNGNVKLQEVLDGKAVFVYDDTDDVNRLGAYRSTDPENVRRFHYVQEMLNQVVPRKRNLEDPFNPNTGAQYPYSLMDEDGRYDAFAYNGLIVFKDNFKLDVNNKVGPYPYATNLAEDNTSAIFRKLMKDYGKRRQGTPWLIDGAANDSWLYKVIDKNTLIKSTKRIPLSNEKVTTDNADVLINGVAGNTRNDTGLYELYKNAVESFNRNLINLAESYKQNANPGNGLGGQPGQWVPREGPAQVKTNNITPLAVAYSYGGRQTIRQFNDTVSRHGAPRTGDFTNSATYRSYRGRIGDVADNLISLFPHGNIGGGEKKWTGLYKDEYINDTLDHHFYFEYWTGIDCIGLTLHGLRYAHDPLRSDGQSTYVADQMLSGNGDSLIPGVNIGRVCVSNDCNTLSGIHNNSTATSPLMNTSVRKFFHSENHELVYYWTRTDASTKFIREGDLIRYRRGNADTHISTVYSDKPTCVDQNDSSTCTYEIVHAYGGDEYGEYTYPSYEHDPTLSGQTVFARKVIRTWQDIAKPTGFGRTKLWD